MFLFSDDSTLHTEFSDASNAPETPLKISEQVHPKWDGLLMEFCRGSGLQQPDVLQLHCLQGLTGSSKQALLQWFRKMADTNTTTEAAIGTQNLDSHFQDSDFLTSDIQLVDALPHTLSDVPLDADPLDPTLQNINTLLEAQHWQTRPNTNPKALAPRPLLHTTIASNTSIYGQDNVMKPANFAAPFLNTPRAALIQNLPFATPVIMETLDTNMPNFNNVLGPSLLEHSGVHDLVQQELQRRALRCSTGHNIQGHGGYPCSFKCGLLCRDNTTRGRHENERFPDRLWFCNICGDINNANSKSLFTRKDKFKGHIKGHGVLNRHQISTTIIQSKLDMDLISRPCGLCPRQIKASDMLKHVKMHICEGESMLSWRDDDGGDDDDDDDENNDASGNEEDDDNNTENRGGSNEETDNGDGHANDSNTGPSHQPPNSSSDQDFNLPDDNLNHDYYPWSYSSDPKQSGPTSPMSKEVHPTQFQMQSQAALAPMQQHLQRDFIYSTPLPQAGLENSADGPRSSNRIVGSLQAAVPTVSHERPWASHRPAGSSLLGVGAQFHEHEPGPSNMRCLLAADSGQHFSPVWKEDTDRNVSSDKDDGKVDVRRRSQSSGVRLPWPRERRHDLDCRVIPLVDEFREKLKCHWTNVNDNGQRFVDTDRVKRWLEASPTHSVHSRFSILFSAVPSSSSMGIEAQSGTILLFSILLSLGCCELLPRFIDAGLNDQTLPISESFWLKRVRPSSPLERRTLRLFPSYQWEWCPSGIKYGKDFTDHGRKVLPVTRRERIDQQGATGEVHKVQVHSGFSPETSMNPDAANPSTKITSVQSSTPA